jgi:L-asparaginase II
VALIAPRPLLHYSVVTEMQPLVTVHRGDLVESLHYGSIAVTDPSGRLLAFAGAPDATAYLRSAAKPFQAIPLVSDGGIEEYDLTGEELALICASHGGEEKHVTTAAAILRKGEFDETDLQCGAHAPLSESAAAELRAAGEQPSALHNNCSGKHGGMLLASLLSDVPPSGYLDREHPLQRRITSTLAAFAGVEPASIPIAVDGCGVPTHYLTIHRMATAWARLMAAAEGMAPDTIRSEWSDAARAIVAAMAGHPDYVAGEWSITTPLIEAFDGAVIGKDGAEGVYTIGLSRAIAPALCSRLRAADSPVGIAIKIADGSMSRGRNPVIVRTLELLGLDTSRIGSLRAAGEFPVRNVAGREVGRVTADFDLNFL